MTPRLRVHFAAFVLFVPFFAAAAEPIDRAEIEALRARVRELEAQLQAIAQRLDATDPPRVASEPVARAGAFNPSNGMQVLGATEGENTIRLRGLVQLDARAFFEDADAATDTFTLRRARLMADGAFARRYGFQFVTEFGGSDFSIRDASLTAQLSEAVQLKAGKFKPPFGLELLQQGHVRPLVERSLVTNFVPIRDTGLQVGGGMFDGQFDYAAGVFNGVTDGGISNNADLDEPKDFVLRLMWHPLKRESGGARQGLSLGIAATRGRQTTAAGHLPAYRTDGQQVFFAYAPSVHGEGEVSRLSPQFDYRLGPFGVMGEWVVSSAGLHAGSNTPVTDLRHRSWQITSSYVLTGENSSFYGIVPQADFAPGGGAWGAFEVVARYADVDIDDAAFPVFASPETNASEVGALTLGLNWYLSKTVRFMFNYSEAKFGLVEGVAAVAPLLRNGERVFASRLQLAF